LNIDTRGAADLPLRRDPVRAGLQAKGIIAAPEAEPAINRDDAGDARNPAAAKFATTTQKERRPHVE
jgi:hypothetical protein